MHIEVNLAVGLVFAAICGFLAHGKGRSPLGWATLGLFFSCFAMIALIVLPDVAVDDARRKRLRLQNSRLREQLKKERQVADARHAQTTDRLGKHDALLGVDTAPIPGAALAASPTPPRLAVQRSDGVDRHDSTRWHYAVEGGTASEGPVAFAEIKVLWRAGEIDQSSLLWTAGMDEWETVEDLPDVWSELRNA